MRKSNKIRIFLCACLAASALTVLAATAGGGAGSQADPLITLSYLNETFTAQIMDKVDRLLIQRGAALEEALPAQQADAYSPVTLSAGQVLHGEAGCEVVLRTGTARCGGSGGLINVTSGGTLGSETSLEANHLYLMPESRSITAADGAILLVRVSYTLE